MVTEKAMEKAVKGMEKAAMEELDSWNVQPSRLLDVCWFQW